MLADAFGDFQFADFLVDDLLGKRAQDEMHLMRARIHFPQQPLEIDRATGPGPGDDEFHEGR